jgi:hypothetical protein
MEVSVKWLYDRIDGHEPSLVVSGRKHAHCVVLDYPIRVFQSDVRNVAKMRPVDKEGRPYSAVAFAKDYLNKERTHGITQAAKRLCQLVLECEGKPIADDNVAEDSVLTDNPDSELTRNQGPPPKRLTPSEVKESINRKNDEFDIQVGAPGRAECGHRSGSSMCTVCAPVKKIKRFTTKKKEQKFERELAKQKGEAPPETSREASLVGTICAELGIEPKKARKLLRAAGMSAPYTDEAKIRGALKK